MGKIAQAVHTPEVAKLVDELASRLPLGTTLFLIAVGQVDDTGGREIVVGGDTDCEPERLAAADVLIPDREGRESLLATRPLTARH